VPQCPIAGGANGVIAVKRLTPKDRFLKKEVWEPNSGGFGINKWGRGAVGMRIEAPPLHWGGEPLLRKKSILGLK